MNFEWILLALFLSAMILEIAKALTRPMHRNVLNLISIPVAFLITYILQAMGVFQGLATQLVEFIASSFTQQGMSDGTDLLAAILSTMLSPLMFYLAYLLIKFLIRTVHVTLLSKYIEKRQLKKEKRLLKIAIKEEKELVKNAIIDSEERAIALLEALEEQGIDYDDLDDYDSMDEDDIEDMVERRVRKEKRAKRKRGFFKESAKKKAVSIVAAAVSGFLAFAIFMMPVFYTMDVLSDMTDGIDKNDPQDTKIYLAVDFFDNHLVGKYEDTFVYQVYKSMGLVDLMVDTVSAGGIVEINGEKTTADKFVRDILKNTVTVATQIMSDDPNPEALRNALNGIIQQPILFAMIVDGISTVMDEVNLPDTGDESDIMQSITNNIVNHYKKPVEPAMPQQDQFATPEEYQAALEQYEIDKARYDADLEAYTEMLKGDVGSLTDVIVTLVEKKLFVSLVSGGSDFGAILTDKNNLRDILGAMSGLSAYQMVMSGAFEMGVNMIAPFLGVPTDNAAGYDLFVNKIVSSADGITAMTEEDIDNLHKLFVNASGFVSENENNTSNGILAYIADPVYKADTLRTNGERVKDEAEKIAAAADALAVDILELEKLLSDNALTDDEKTFLRTQITKLNEKLSKESLTDEEIQATRNRIDGLTSIVNGDDQLDEAEKDVIDDVINGKIADEKNLNDDVERLETAADELIKQAEELAKNFEERIAMFTPFITYFMNWINIQKPFMLAGEDESLAIMSIKVPVFDESGLLEGEKTYVCNTNILSIETIIDSFFGADDSTDPDAPADEGTTEGPSTAAEGEGTTTDGEGSAGGEGTTEEIPDKTIDDYLNEIPLKDILEQLTVTELTQENAADYENKISPIADLINYIIEEASTYKSIDSALTVDLAWVENKLSYFKGDEDSASKKLVDKILAVDDALDQSKQSFDYLSVTVEDMQNSLRFDESWTAELREQDSEKLVDVVFTLIDMVGALGGSEKEEGTETLPEGEEPVLTSNTAEEENGGEDSTGEESGNDMTAMLDMLKVLGTTFDIMADTHALGELPALMLEGLLKNEMLSMVMLPSMLGEYMQDMQSEDFTYESFMTEFVDTIAGLLDKMSAEGGETE